MVCPQLTVVQAVSPPNPQIFNICWGASLTAPCSVPPQMPAVPPGGAVKIMADIANSGNSGKVRAVFKANGVGISDQNSTLNTFPQGGMWSPQVSYTMPASAVTLTVEAYGWDGTNWVLKDTQSVTISPTAPACTSITLTPFSASIKQGDKVMFTATATPATQAFTVKFKDTAGNVLGTCATSGGSCTFTWDSTGKAAGTYYVIASVEGQCTSTTAVITVNAPIPQYNLNIYALDSVTLKPVSGATVSVGTQTKQTDANGLAQFRADQGTVTVSISAPGYNTYTTSELLFSDRSISYYLTSTAPTTGSIMFVSVPSNAEIFIDGQDQGAKTAYQIFNIPAGKHTFTLKLAGYNDTTGEVTVTGGGTVQAYATLSPTTPAAGSLSFYSTPPNAEIFIDGTDMKATTPATITNLSPGEHDVRLTLTGYQDWTGKVTITAGQTAYLSPALTPLTTTGALEITSTPPGARVYIDGSDVQRITPATVTNLPVGDHTYLLKLQGYSDAPGRFKVEAGKTAAVSVELKKPPSNAMALVTVAVIGAGLVALGIAAGR